MLRKLLVASLVVRSAVSQQQWVTIFKCDGRGQTDDRWLSGYGRRGWENLNGLTLQEFAKTATKLRICTAGNYEDCVTTKGDNVALKNLRNGDKYLQPQSWDKMTHGVTCNQDCVNEDWEGPSNRLKQMWWGCGTSKNEVFQACNNDGGLHISIDNAVNGGRCEWDYGSSDRLEIQLLVPSKWTTVFSCWGHGDTGDRVVENEWQELAQRSSAVRICSWGSDTDCVESSGTALTNLRNGVKLMQDTGIKYCDIDCVKNEWSGPENRLKQMWWNCGIGGDTMFYHACRNTKGLHIRQDGGDCAWDWEESDKIDIQLLVDLPTRHPSAGPTPAPTGTPTTPAPTGTPTTPEPTTKAPTSNPTVTPMRFEEYKALCALTADTGKDACKGLGCKYKKKKDKAKCIAKPGKKTKCWKVTDQDVCLRLGCEIHAERGCIGRPENLFDN